MILKELIASTHHNKTNITLKCSRQGTIDSQENPTTPEDIILKRKRINLFSRKDSNLKLLATRVSKPDKTWEIIAYPPEADGDMFIMCFDDTGTYNSESFDRVKLNDKTFNYLGSDLQKIGEFPEFLLQKSILNVDRSIFKPFSNWLFDLKLENKNNNYFLANWISQSNLNLVGVKSVIFDIAGNWGNTAYIGIRRVEFYDLSGNLIPITSSTVVCYATSRYDTTYHTPIMTFTTALSKIGDFTSNQWLSGSGLYTNQRLICVFNTVKSISKIVINNAHNSGGITEAGAKQVRIATSTDAITNTTYMNPLTNFKVLFHGNLPQHIASDKTDDYILQNGNFNFTEQHSNIKSVIFDIKDNWGNVSYMGIRRVEFFDSSYNRISITSSTVVCYATSRYDNTYYTPIMTFTTALSKIGDFTSNQWLSLDTNPQRLICVFNTVRNIKYIHIDNGHHYGEQAGYTGVAAKQVKVYTSTSAITSTIYGSPISNGTLIFDGIFPSHIALDVCDGFIIKPNVPNFLVNNLYEQITIPDNIVVGDVITTIDGNRFPIIDNGGIAKVSNGLTYDYINRISKIISIQNVLGALRYYGNLLYETAFLDSRGTMFDEISSMSIKQTLSLSSEGNTYLSVIVDHTKIDSDLINFPLLIRLTRENASLVFNNIRDDKLKIKLLDKQDTQKYIEIESWDSTNEFAILHTKVNLSSTEDTEFRLYFNEASDNTTWVGVTGSTAARNVWDSNFKAVYTMAQDPSVGGACILDSTVNANHGTPYGSMPSGNLVNGLVGKAIDFDGIDDYINIPHHSSLVFGNNTTIEALYKITSSMEYGAILSKSTQAHDGYTLFATQNGSQIIPTIYSQSVEIETVVGDTSYTALQYAYLTKSNVFHNANSPLATPNTIAPYDYSSSLQFGKLAYAGYYTRLQIEHIRISNIARSDAWIKATYLNLRDALNSYAINNSDDTTSPAKVYYSISFDQCKTYNIFKDSSWIAIASCLDSVHGNIGDTDWYYKTDIDTWSKSNVVQSRFAVISKAVSYSANQMEKAALTAIPATAYNDISDFNMAITMTSTTLGKGATISNLYLNDSDTDISELEPIDLSVYPTITSSNISWEYTVNAGFVFDDVVKVYAKVGESSAWELCSNGSSIPQVIAGMSTAGKKLFVKATMPRLAVSDTDDPYKCIFNIDIK